MLRLQASAGGEFHAEKRQTVLAFAHLVNRQNVRMIEAGCRFGFASKARERLMRIGVITKDAFYRDDAAGVSLARTINHAHAAAPDLVENLVIAQAPLLVRHVDFTEHAFESSLATSQQRLPALRAEDSSHKHQFQVAWLCRTFRTFTGLLFALEVRGPAEFFIG